MQLSSAEKSKDRGYEVQEFISSVLNPLTPNDL
jgi:hypothetical protein